MKKLLCVLGAVLVLLSLLTGCVDRIWDLAGSASRSYSTEDLSIELHANMIDLKGEEFEEYEMVRANDKFGVFLLREEREDCEDCPDLQSYGEMLLEAALQIGDTEPSLSQSAAGNPVLCYGADVDGERFSYYSVLLENEEAYFDLQFYCEEGKYEELLPEFEACEASVTMK